MMDTSGDKEKKTPKKVEEEKNLIFIPEKAKNLQNIRSVTELKSSKYNKHIYIFGEIHNANFSCYESIPVYQFIIEQLTFLEKMGQLNISKKTIDFFLEVPFSTSDKKKESNLGSKNINKIYNKFIDCFMVNKKCDNNIRFHYSDIRRKYAGSDIVNTDFIINSIYNMFHFYHSKAELIKLWKKFNEYSYEKYPEEYKEYKKSNSGDDFIIRGMKMFNGSKLFKNMSKIVYKEVRNIVQEYIKLTIPNLYKYITFEFINDFMWNLDKIDEKTYIETCRTILESTTAYMVVFMDAYLISRAFRKFNLRLGESKEREEPKNIIIYVGNFHANNYLQILKKLGFEIVFRNSNNDGSCLDISKLQQPLFMSKSEYQNIENYNREKLIDKLKNQFEEEYGVSGDLMEEGIF